jgi:hypothetical protein
MRLRISLLLLLLTCEQVFGQSIRKNLILKNSVAKHYLIDGTSFFSDHYEKAAAYFASHPAAERSMRMQKKTSWNFQVGSQKNWWIRDFTATLTDRYYQTTTTCRKVGSHCYIFVEDAMWESGNVNNAEIDSLENNFDNKTPANPNEGIFVMDSLAFGAPPDVDNDPKVIILLCHIRSGIYGSYFSAINELPTSVHPFSNQADMFYVDVYYNLLSTEIEYTSSMLAHEFQHMINFNYHKTNFEPIFINEGCATLAEIYCGYTAYFLHFYTDETNINLFNWRTIDNTLVINDYGRAQRFFLYVWDRFGIGIIKYIVQSQQTSEIDILNDAFTKAGMPLTFSNIFHDWSIANELNDTTVNRLYGYAYPGLPISNGKNISNPIDVGTDTVRNLGVEYLIFIDKSDLNISFTYLSDNSNLTIEAIEIVTNANKVVSVPLGSQFFEPSYSTTYSKIVFVAINTDVNNSAYYNYIEALPLKFILFQNYPNPFNLSTTITFSISSKSFVSLKVYDLLGREVSTIVSEQLLSGSYIRQWNASSFASGIYFYRLQAGSYLETKKLVLLK